MSVLPRWLEPFEPPVREAVQAALRDGAQPLVCFDADGTLGAEDIGEAFLRWLAEGGLLPGRDADAAALWHEYEARVAADRAAGYAWAVQSMAGLAEADVDLWSRQLAAAWPNYRPAMAGLARGLAEAGGDVWVVSASNAWTVQAAVPRAGIDPAHVIGIRVEVEDGRLTGRVVRPVICHGGKVEAIRSRFGRDPDLAFGDSLGDLEMLEAARHPIVIGRTDRAGADLPRLARERGWPIHRF